jgi:hypothetical protein
MNSAMNNEMALRYFCAIPGVEIHGRPNIEVMWFKRG